MPNTSKIVVLIADDEPSTVAMLSSHLRSSGYAVLEASDGDQAWELAHEHLPHLVILDVMMPGMSGWEVCRKIREAVSLAHTGVIMLTGIGETLNEMTSPLYGADAHVDKPFEFVNLDRKIEETLERRRAGALGRADGATQDDVRLRVESAPPDDEDDELEDDEDEDDELEGDEDDFDDDTAEDDAAEDDAPDSEAPKAEKAPKAPKAPP